MLRALRMLKQPGAIASVHAIAPGWDKSAVQFTPVKPLAKGGQIGKNRDFISSLLPKYCSEMGSPDVMVIS